MATKKTSAKSTSAKGKKSREMADGIMESVRELQGIIDSGQHPVTYMRNHHPELVRTYTFIEPGRHTPVMVRKLRDKLGMSQAIFARMIGVSTILVQSWERGVREPSTMARRLLDTISRDPAAWVSSVVVRKAG